jgi:L-alanine-DL-glutamate epimerase-like enolase superfamily enzyme
MLRRTFFPLLTSTSASFAQSSTAIRRSLPSQRVCEVRFGFQDFAYRTPYVFGGAKVDRVTILNVICRNEGKSGRSAFGFGSMTLGNAWAFPSPMHSYVETLEAMKALASICRQEFQQITEFSQPIPQGVLLEQRVLQKLPELQKSLGLKQPIPKLAMLVVLSAFDAALHDSFGRLHQRPSWATYGADMHPDLGQILGSTYQNQYASQFVTSRPRDYVWLYHSVGASDPLISQDVKQRPSDDLPFTLGDWILYAKLTHLKIKLTGTDVQADIDRTIAIDRIARESMTTKNWRYCVDFNERCPNEETLLQFLRQVREKTPDGFQKIQYIEQPTQRDLKTDLSNTMFRANKLRPIVIDESLTDIESLEIAKSMGYTGVALKACKGQTQVLLTAAAAAKTNMFLCVQDLTCPGASFLHSAAIASHVKGVSAMEGNGRQYVPIANQTWNSAYPGVFDIRNGKVNTRILNGHGLGVRPDLFPSV